MALLAVGETSTTLKNIYPDPSSLGWGLQDISASDAGRVQEGDNPMQKMRTSQKRKLTLGWTMPTDEQTAAILQAFNPEYVYVRYFDAMDCRQEIRRFYVGDRSAPLKWIDNGMGTRYSTLTFDIVEV